MDITNIFPVIGTIVGMFIGIPQIMKTIKLKSVEDVSATTFVLIVVTAACFLVRMIVLKEYVFIFYYSFIILSALLQLFLIWRFQSR